MLTSQVENGGGTVGVAITGTRLVKGSLNVEREFFSLLPSPPLPQDSVWDGYVQRFLRYQEGVA